MVTSGCSASEDMEPTIAQDLTDSSTNFFGWGETDTRLAVEIAMQTSVGVRDGFVANPTDSWDGLCKMLQECVSDPVKYGEEVAKFYKRWLPANVFKRIYEKFSDKTMRAALFRKIETMRRAMPAIVEYFEQSSRAVLAMPPEQKAYYIGYALGYIGFEVVIEIVTAGTATLLKGGLLALRTQKVTVHHRV